MEAVGQLGGVADRADSAAGPTLSEASLWAQRTLVAAQVDSPRLDADLLLAYALGWQRARLYACSDMALQSAEWLRYEDLVSRRARREPLAYLLGQWEFYGIPFFVDRRVLIPRPETEILVEQAIRHGTQMLESVSHLTVADVGTGCGAIAIALAVSLPTTRVYATDLSKPALEVAARNCRRHGVAGRVHLLHGDLLSPLPERVDLVVANLPYVASGEAAALSPEVRCFEPRRAWDGGDGGTEIFERLLAQAGRYVKIGGSILLEIGCAQAHPVLSIVRRCLPGAVVEVRRDHAGRDRVVRVAQVHANTRPESGRDLA